MSLIHAPFRRAALRIAESDRREVEQKRHRVADYNELAIRYNALLERFNAQGAEIERLKIDLNFASALWQYFDGLLRKLPFSQLALNAVQRNVLLTRGYMNARRHSVDEYRRAGNEPTDFLREDLLLCEREYAKALTAVQPKANSGGR